MSKLIIYGLETMLSILGFLIVSACVYGMMKIAGEYGQTEWTIISGIFGAVFGVLLAGVVIGIPIVLIEINKNIEKLVELMAKR